MIDNKILQKPRSRQLVDCLLIAANRGREVRKAKIATESTTFSGVNDSVASENANQKHILAIETHNSNYIREDSIIANSPSKRGES